ncbi:MAG TPA: hypothetical protein VG675_09575 [Bryobacteraceae bacterium]|nr:hypothetical protein [Bryobacteraceae bacterium]
MSYTLAALVFSIFAVVSLVVILRRQLGCYRTNRTVTPGWIEELSAERYRPMLRLLDQEDFRLLQAQPGFTPKMAATLRQQRCRIFQQYMRSLDADFDRVCTAVKILMLRSSRDRADLAAVLVRSQLLYAYGKMMIQLRLCLYRRGLSSVDVSGLLGIFGTMSVELRSLVPAASAAAA